MNRYLTTICDYNDTEDNDWVPGVNRYQSDVLTGENAQSVAVGLIEQAVPGDEIIVTNADYDNSYEDTTWLYVF